MQLDYDGKQLVVVVEANTHIKVKIRDQSPTTKQPAPEPGPGSEPDVARRVVLPLAAMLAVLAWSNVPAYRGHIQERERELFAWTWSIQPQVRPQPMCVIRYYDLNEGGAPIERWKALGYARPGLEPVELMRTTRRTLARDARVVCSRLRRRGYEPRLQSELRCRVDGDWKLTLPRGKQLCWEPRSRSASR